MFPVRNEIVAAFRGAVAADGDGAAIVGCDGAVSSRTEFSSAVARLSGALQACASTRRATIALRLPRSAALVAATLASVDSGLSFTLADPHVPLAYLVRAWRAAGLAPLIVVTAGLAPGEDTDGLTVVTVEALMEAGARSEVATPASPPSGELYVVATSGSSSAARLVSGSAVGTMNRLQWMASSPRLRLTTSDVVLLRTPPAFVDAIAESLAPVAAGATAVVLPDGALGDAARHLDAWFCAAARAAVVAAPGPGIASRAFAAPACTLPRQPMEDLPALLRLIADQRATRITVTPQLLDALLALAAGCARGAASPLASLRVVVTSGDVLRAGTVRRWAAHFSPRPPPTLVNLYGSAETSADATWSDVFADAPWRACVRVGADVPHRAGGIAAADASAAAVASSDRADDSERGDDGEPVPVGVPLPGLTIGLAAPPRGYASVALRYPVQQWLHADGSILGPHVPIPAAGCGRSAAQCGARHRPWVRPVTTVGRIVVRGVGVALGYVGVPSATSAVAAARSADANFVSEPGASGTEFWSTDEGRFVALCRGPCGAHGDAIGDGGEDARELTLAATPSMRACPCGCGGAFALQVVGRLAAADGAGDIKVRGVRVHASQVEAEALRTPPVVLRRLQPRDSERDLGAGVVVGLRGVPTFARLVVNADPRGPGHGATVADVFVGFTWTRVPPFEELPHQREGDVVPGVVSPAHVRMSDDAADAVAAVYAHLVAHLPPGAVPARAHVHVLTHACAGDVDATALPPRVPLLPSGKPSTAALMDAACEAAAAASAARTAAAAAAVIAASQGAAHFIDGDVVRAHVRTAFAAALGVDVREVCDATDFFDAGGDSLAAVRLVTGSALECAGAHAMHTDGGARAVGSASSGSAMAHGNHAVGCVSADLVRGAVTFDALLRWRTPAALAALLLSAAASMAAADVAHSGTTQAAVASADAVAIVEAATESTLCGVGAATSVDTESGPEVGDWAGDVHPTAALHGGAGAHAHAMRVWSRASPAAATWRCPGSCAAADGAAGAGCEWVLLGDDDDDRASGDGGTAHDAPLRCHAARHPSVMWSMSLGGCVDAGALVVSRHARPQATRARESSAAAAAEAAVVIAIVGSHSGDVAAVDVATGAIVWRTALPDHVEGAAALHPWSDTAVVPCYDGRVYGVCLTTGSVRWCFPPPSPRPAPEDARRRHRERGGAGALADEGEALQGARDASGGSRDDGSALGEALPPDPVKATPLVDPRSRLVWVAGYGRTLHVVRVPAALSDGCGAPDDGDIVSDRQHDGGDASASRKRRARPGQQDSPPTCAAVLVACADLDGSVAASPVLVRWRDGNHRVHGGIAVVTTAGYVTVYFRIADDGSAPAVSPSTPPSRATVAWTGRTSAPVFGTPAVLPAASDGGDVLCVPTTDGVLVAFAAATGAVLWRYVASAALVSAPCPLRLSPRRDAGPPRPRGPVLVLGAHDGSVHALDVCGAAVWTTPPAPAHPCACAVGVTPRTRGGAVVVSVLQDGSVRVFDAATGAALDDGAARRVRAPAFAPPVTIPASLLSGEQCAIDARGVADGVIVLVGSRDDHLHALYLGSDWPTSRLLH